MNPKQEHSYLQGGSPASDCHPEEKQRLWVLGAKRQGSGECKHRTQSGNNKYKAQRWKQQGLVSARWLTGMGRGKERKDLADILGIATNVAWKFLIIRERGCWGRERPKNTQGKVFGYFCKWACMKDSNFIMCSIKMGWKADWTVRCSYKKQPEKTDTKSCAFQTTRPKGISNLKGKSKNMEGGGSWN